MIVDLTYPFYEGLGTTEDVPGLFPVGINGRGYLIDRTHKAWGRRTLELLRAQADDSEVPSERSLNPEGLWRRSAESWHLGAGQSQHDRPESSRHRFRSSKGVYVFERWEMTLLPDTVQLRASANTNLAVVPVGSYLYVADGTEVYRTQDTSPTATWTAVGIQNGETPARSVESLVSDGYNVWAALGAGGVHTTTRGAATSSHYSDLAATLLGWVKGRLMAAETNSIYNITATGAAPSALFDHPNTDFTWVGFAEGSRAIYAAGNSGDKSEIYRIGIKSDGTGLDAAIPATPGWPDGEVIRSIGNYLGFVAVGTDKGWRLCGADTNGDLEIGALVETPAAVRCFEGQDRFLFYGLTNYDGTSTGVGRADLSTVDHPDLAALTAAYASDLMVTGQGAVNSVATFANLRVLAVAGLGVYVEDDTLVASGTLRGGIDAYDLPDDKVALFFDVRNRPTDAGSYTARLSVDEGAFESIGTETPVVGATGRTFNLNQQRGENFEVELELTRDAADDKLGPALTRRRLRAFPAPERTIKVFLPLLLHENLEARGLLPSDLDPLTEVVRFEGYLNSVVSVQEGARSYSLWLDDYTWEPANETEDGNFHNGTIVLELKTTA